MRLMLNNTLKGIRRSLRLMLNIKKINFKTLFKRLVIASLIILIVSSILFVYKKRNAIVRYKNSLISSLYQQLDIYNKPQVNIEGCNRTELSKIKKLVEKNLDLATSQEQNIDKLIKIIKGNNKWVDSIHIFRTLPNKINIKITEYRPFAAWKDSDKLYVVDTNGNKIRVKNLEEFDELLIISGKDAYLYVKSLFNLMVINPDISSMIYSATWVGNRRWDLRFDNGVLVKLPSTKISQSWNELVKLYKTEGAFFNLKVIDLRVKDKIYLEYKSY